MTDRFPSEVPPLPDTPVSSSTPPGRGSITPPAGPAVTAVTAIVTTASSAAGPVPNNGPSWLAQLHGQLVRHEERGAATRQVLDDYKRLYSQTLYLAKINQDHRRRGLVAAPSLSSGNAPPADHRGHPERTMPPRSESSSSKMGAISRTQSENASDGPESARWEQLWQEKDRLESEYNRTATQLSDLQKQVVELERQTRHQARELEELRRRGRQLETQMHDANHLLRAKDQAIQVAQDELAATQLELNVKETRLSQLEKEHRELLERWLAQKAEAAARLNSANDAETAVRAVAAKVGGTFRAIGSMWATAAQAGVAAGALQGSGSRDSLTSAAADDAAESRREPWPPKHGAEALVVPQRLVRTVHAHLGESTTISTSRDGALVATGGSDKLVKIWNPGNGMSLVTTLPATLGSVVSLAFSPSSMMLATGSADNTLRLYTSPPASSPATTRRSSTHATATGSAPVQLLQTLTGHTGKVSAVAISAREDVVVSAAADRTLKVWDIAKGYCTKTLVAFSAATALTIADYSAATLVTSHQDGHVRVWDVASGSCGAEIMLAGAGPAGAAAVAVEMLDPNTVITLSKDNVLRVVDVRAREVTTTYESSFFRLGTSRLAVSPGGGFTAAGAADGSVFVWDMRSREATILTGGHGTMVTDVSWNPHDGAHLYSIDKSGRLSQWTA